MSTWGEHVGQNSFALPGHWGPRPTGHRDDIEEEVVRDQQEVQPLLIYMALAEIPPERGNKLPAEGSNSLLPISCRHLKHLSSTALLSLVPEP